MENEASIPKLGVTDPSTEGEEEEVKINEKREAPIGNKQVLVTGNHLAIQRCDPNTLLLFQRFGAGSGHRILIGEQADAHFRILCR